VELKKGETIMIDAALHLPASILRVDFSDRSGVPLDFFELYYRGKRLEGGAALASWGVGKDSTIEVKMRGRGGGSNADEDALRAMRAASPALQKEWPDGESPRSWKCVVWSDDRVRRLDLDNSGLEVLAPQIGQLQALTHLGLESCPLKELPPQVGQLQALTHLGLRRCPLKELPPQVGQLQALIYLNLSRCPLKVLPPQVGQLLALTKLGLDECRQLTLAPGAKKDQPAQTIVAAYARLLIVEPRKDAPGQLHAFLLANPLWVPAFFKSILTDAAHAVWLGEAVKANPSLAELTDADGRRAIDLAVPECKQAMQAALFLLGRFEVDDGKLLHRSATAAVAAATDHGDPEAKPVPRVALKAMREVEQVCAELNGRVGLAPGHVVAVKAVYADKAAVGDAAWQQLKEAAAELGIKTESTPGLSGLIQAQLFPSKQEVGQPSPDAAPGAAPAAGRELKRGLSVRTLEASSEYKLLIVLELADRTLKHTIDHEHIAGKDFLAIRHIAAHLAEGLDHVHAKGGIHADLKPLNAVGDRDTWKIIDFDVFCTLGQPFGNKVPSSGYCPPEMARVLLRAMNEQGGVDGAKLAEYKASEAYDLWSFGVVLFHLCFGRPLWLTDINDNVTLEDLRTLASVPDALLKSRIRKALSKGLDRDATTDLKTAADLLLKLLEPNEKTRLANFYEQADSPMKSVLKEPFFQVQGLDEVKLAEMDAKLDKIERHTLKLIDMSEEHRTELLLTRKVCPFCSMPPPVLACATCHMFPSRHTFTLPPTPTVHKVLLKGIFEATEVLMPTTFIILDEELPPVLSAKEQYQLMLKEDGSGSELTGEAKVAKEQFDKAMTWLGRLQTIGEGVNENNPSKVFGKIKKVLGDLMTKETMYLYLIDELTGLPVRGDGYPIVITTPADIVHMLIPVMQVGIRAMSLFNGVAGVAQMVGYPVPKVSEEWRKGAQSSVEMLKQVRLPHSLSPPV